MGKIVPGLVSISFRKKSPIEVIELVKKAGLAAIEWGGDVHVPHGDVGAAEEVRRMTGDNGLQVAAYGSYYRVGTSENEGLPFEKVLESAVALGAPLIRVWPGIHASASAQPSYRKWVTDECRRIAAMAMEAKVRVACEYHTETLTDENTSAVRLMKDVDHPNFVSMWQPPNGRLFPVCMESLNGIFPWLANIHVFHWWPTAAERLPLEQGKDRWQAYLKKVGEKEGDRFALMEFVRNDDEAQLLTDAAVLNDWLAAP